MICRWFFNIKVSYCFGNKEKHLCCLPYEYLYGVRMVLEDPQTSSQIKGLVDSSTDTQTQLQFWLQSWSRTTGSWEGVTSDKPPFGHGRFHAREGRRQGEAPLFRSRDSSNLGPSWGVSNHWPCKQCFLFQPKNNLTVCTLWKGQLVPGRSCRLWPDTQIRVIVSSTIL